MQLENTPKHIRNLDILRGIAALVVVGFHLISCYPKGFDKYFELGPIVNYNFPGHMSVLVFFILSGYVIAANTKALTDKKSIFSYIRKRLTRIVPIYLVVLLFTVIITFGLYDWKAILSNLFFISVPLDNVIVENGPLWSLHYELLYYFVYILFAYYNISLTKTVMVLAAAIGISFVFFHNVEIHPLLISYFIGFLFWVTGAMIAKVKTWPRWEISGSRIIAVFILIFCLQQLNPYGPVLKVLHIPVVDYTSGGTYAVYTMYQQLISWSDLYYYPLTILLILALTHSYTKYHLYITWFIFISALFRLGMIYKTYGLDFIIREHYVVPAVILIASVVLWLLNFDINATIKQKLGSVSRLGSISYGVYIAHLPIIYFFGRITTSSWSMFLLKVVAYIVTLLLVSWLLEEKFQMWVKRMLRKKPVTVAFPSAKEETS